MASSSQDQAIRLHCYVKNDAKAPSLEVRIPPESLRDAGALRKYIASIPELSRRLSARYPQNNWKVLSHLDDHIKDPRQQLADQATVVLGLREEATLAPIEVRSVPQTPCFPSADGPRPRATVRPNDRARSLAALHLRSTAPAELRSSPRLTSLQVRARHMAHYRIVTDSHSKFH